MSARAAAATAFAVIVLAMPAQAQGDQWERQVRRQLERAATSLGSGRTANPIATRVGMLNTDESQSFRLTLHAGTAYVVLGACDQDCAKLGLVLSDVASHELAADHAGDNTAAVRLTVRATGSYQVRTVMETCRMNPCRYGVAVLTPPAP